MPKVAIKVQGASYKTRWTLSPTDTTHSPAAKEAGDWLANTMPPVNGAYYDNAAPAREEYEALPQNHQRMNSTQSKHYTGAIQTNGYYHEDVTHQTPLEERASYQLGSNTRMRSQNQDSVSLHLLYETALLDTKPFEILTLEEVDALKKERARLNSRIDAAQRKLTLESKVRDAAHNLQRLYSVKGGRADTPQTPESPKKSRRSLLGQRRSSGSSASGAGESLSHAEDELASSVKKVEALNDTIKTMLERRSYVERRLLSHTAAILAEQHSQNSAHLANGNHHLDDDAVSMYEPDEFDGIRDILGGRTISKNSQRINSGHAQEEHEQQLENIQSRLERFNNQIRTIIKDVSRSRGVSLPPEPYEDEAQDIETRLDRDFQRLESNLRTLEQEHLDTKNHYAQVQDSIYKTRNAVEEQLQAANTALYNTLSLSPSARSIQDLSDPPQVTGHGYQYQIQYLEDTMASLEPILHHHNEQLENAKDNGEALAKSAAQTQKVNEYEATVAGLWEILQSDDNDKRSADSNDGSRSPMGREPFSLPAFSSRVQHLFDRFASSREQHDILRRQIQQQRELNNKSDADKDAHIGELRDNHQAIVTAHNNMQNDLAEVMAKHATSETEASQLRNELSNVETELVQLRQTADSREKERDEMTRQLQLHQANTAQSQSQLREANEKHEELSSHLSLATSARDNKAKEMEDLESEVVRLTTELTMAKAELDGAYGSRAERAKEAQKGEVESLKERSTTLEKELAEMMNEFQGLTRESLELERERSQLDSLIDGLRERCESLESQLSDEKVRSMGVKSPNGADNVHPQREMTSMMVMRQEFKKMMRDARAEGVKLLRAEQEERRKLEAEVRRLRQADTPLAKQTNGTPAAQA